MATQSGSPMAQYSPHVVGAAFVKQYYETLRNSPELTYRFYQDSSIIGRVDSNGSMTSVTTIDDINTQLQSTDFTDCLIELETVDSQSSHVNGVVTLVTGSFITGAVKQKFTQSFFLAPQANGAYFVLNDMLRFVLARPSTEGEVIANHDSESAQSAILPAEPETVSVKESMVPDLPSADHIPVNDGAVGSSSNGVSLVQKGSDVKTCAKEFSEDEEKVPQVAAAPALAEKEVVSAPALAEEVVAAPVLAEKDGLKMSYASIVKTMRESRPTVSVAPPKLKPKPKAPQNAEKPVSSPPKPASATIAPPSDKNISKNKSNDEPGYSVFVKNLPYNATVEMVEQVFRKFGAIKPGGIQVRNRQPDRFCFGFVEFESQDSMHAAIEASPVCFGLRESYVEEKKTTTRVIDGVVTRPDDNGNDGGSRFQPGRGHVYQGDSFRARGAGFSNYRDGENMRNGFRNQNEYSGRGRGPQGNGYPQNGGNNYPQNRNGYHQNGNGYHQNGNSYPQKLNGYQQRRPLHAVNVNGTSERTMTGPRQAAAAS